MGKHPLEHFKKCCGHKKRLELAGQLDPPLRHVSNLKSCKNLMSSNRKQKYYLHTMKNFIGIDVFKPHLDIHHLSKHQEIPNTEKAIILANTLLKNPNFSVAS